MKKVRQISPGDKVFAKVKGYPAWPARVDEDLGKKFKVHFYGTGETGMVKAEDLFPYLEHKEQFIKTLKRKDYNDALEEIEAAIKTDAPVTKITLQKSVDEIPKEDTKRGIKRKKSLENDESEPKPRKSPIVKSINNESKKNSLTPVNKVPKEMVTTEEVSKSPVRRGRKLSKKFSMDPEPTEEFKKPAEPVEAEVKPAGYTVISTNQLEVLIGKIVPDKTGAGAIKKIDELAPNKILLAHIDYGKYIGIKLGHNKPENFESEDNRIAWEKSDATTALELKEKLEDGTLSVTDKPDLIITNLNLTKQQVSDATEERIIERKKKKLKWLRIESCLVELDAMIKTSLGLDKADPKKALTYLNTMLKLDIDPLMLKKHPHVVDMVKRLKRYIGNVKEWKLSDDELTEFHKDAKEIREKADLVYNKFKNLFGNPDGRQFWETFLTHVNNFKTLTKDMLEGQVFGLCAEPGSKQARWDELDEQEEMKIIAKKGIKLKSHLNDNDIAAVMFAVIPCSLGCIKRDGEITEKDVD